MPAENLVNCTLLGPEGPGRHRMVPNGPLDSFVTGSLCLSKAARRREYRPYFENYTVDASILDVL